MFDFGIIQVWQFGCSSGRLDAYRVEFQNRCVFDLYDGGDTVVCRCWHGGAWVDVDEQWQRAEVGACDMYLVPVNA